MSSSQPLITTQHPTAEKLSSTTQKANNRDIFFVTKNREQERRTKTERTKRKEKRQKIAKKE